MSESRPFEAETTQRQKIETPDSARLTLLPLSLSDLRRETALDGLHTTSATAAIACDEAETILSFAEFSVEILAGFARHVVIDIPSQNAILN
jgi:hypothetical protein